ncbi:MAG: bifunctional 4-hydroxy-2-oxoglutarate aldolase/2-dehydro-3-deoxy-phosphogluconate aldolase [Rhodospirillales bacterium]
MLLDRLAALKVVPVIRTDRAEEAERACVWLLEAGLQALEVTLSVPDAVPLIADLRRRHPEALVGAGTVLDADAADRCVEAGAAFLVAPAAAPAVAQVAAARGIPFLPGAATPSEVLARWREGAALVKVFPAKLLGGPAFLKTLRSVFPDIPLMPTGGVTPETASDYLAAGALCVGMGGELAPREALATGDKERVMALAHQALAALDLTPNEQP